MDSNKGFKPLVLIGGEVTKRPFYARTATPAVRRSGRRGVLRGIVNPRLAGG